MHQIAKLMITFARVVEAGGISAAARSMDIDKAVVSRQLRSLESVLGVRLLHRATGAPALTDIGTAVFERATRLVGELQEVESEVEFARESPSGVLTVTTSVVFGKHQLIGHLPRFLEQYPSIEVELCLLDRFVHPIEEGFDVLLRICDEPPLDLVAYRLADIRHALVAHPDYLAKAGMDVSAPEDLAAHSCLFYGYRRRRTNWLLCREGEEINVEVTTRLSVNSGEAVRAAALQGLGVALLPHFLVWEDIQTGQLQPLLPDYEVQGDLGTSLYALHLPGRHRSPKVRAFIEYLKALWGDTPWDDWRRPLRTGQIKR